MLIDFTSEGAKSRHFFKYQHLRKSDVVKTTKFPYFYQLSWKTCTFIELVLASSAEAKSFLNEAVGDQKVPEVTTSMHFGSRNAGEFVPNS